MSNDLVKRLRSGARELLTRERVRNGSDTASELRQSPEYRAANRLNEAADRIEALEDENARLREALKHYADESNWIETSVANDDPHDGRLRDVWDGGGDGWTEARAALQDKKTPTD